MGTEESSPGYSPFLRERTASVFGSPGEGVTSNDRTALDFFEPLTRYGDIAPARVEASLARG